MRTGPTNDQLKQLIVELKKKAYGENAMLWKRIASDLEKSSRRRRIVNLSRINRFTSNGEIIIVPGKVLSSGELDKKITIAAWQFSKDAFEKISKADSKAVTIYDLMKSNPDGKNVRIIG